MLWDIIRDFFVMYVFGGMNSIGENFGGVMGAFSDVEGSNYSLNLTDIAVPLNDFHSIDEINSNILYISFGDWLSTTATIITLVALFVGISFLLVSLFRWIVRLVSLRG